MMLKAVVACGCLATCLSASDVFAQGPSATDVTETCALPNPSPSCWSDITATKSTTAKNAAATAASGSAKDKARAKEEQASEQASTPLSAHDKRAQMVEKWMSRFNSTRDGWSPRIGTITSGSGVAFGQMYQQPVFGGAARITSDAMFSIRGYHAIELGAFATPFANPRIQVGARLRHEGYPQEDFYGIGQDSNPGDHTSYLREGLDSSAFVTFTPRRGVSVQASAGYLDMQVRAGHQSDVPSIEQRFDEASAPGLTRDGDLVHAGVTLDIDNRDAFFFPRNGGRYAAGVTTFHGVDEYRGTFLRTDLDLRRYIALPRTQRHVLAVRSNLVMTGGGAGQGAGDMAIPFYMLPRLGGSRTLRGYEASRFTDRQAMAFSIEHRYLATPVLQLVAFADAGQVASSLDGFSVSGFRTSFGAGVRFNIKDTAAIRVDVAKGQEGTRWIVGFGPGF